MLLADSLLAACITTTAGFYPPQTRDAGHFKTEPGGWREVRRYIASKADIKAVKFIITYPLPSSKKAVLAYLGIPLTPGGQPEAPIPITRKAKVDFLDVDAYNDILTLDGGKWGIESLEKLPEGVLPEQIVCDGWSIGYDDRFPQKRCTRQVSISAQLSEHGNLYAHSLISLLTTRTLLSVALGIPSTSFPELSEDAFAMTSRPRIQPPLKSFDFLPDLMEKNEENFKPRDNIKPLHIVQPEGVSFKLDGNELEWQNWKMHISFNHREGECKYAL
ncbi:uncharacterized protein ARMOST_17013 [Armillaria ostoyae]|uniref:Amine oxidase n=1 Tax=Armillaria ostoyae TaxID=47428 RepID=A0A284RXS8_ARMOS|nr:uncharacterized protein ARMOST_17013 [Armillaria ostoyae]